tara:strand:- start:104334 stop:105014 length:681 start_codon:yes stop_codon:yes gene_type:complete
MSKSKAVFELSASKRTTVGKGASRRLRREADLVPAIIYGGDKAPEMLTFKGNEVKKAVEFEAFFSHILTIDVEGTKEKAIIKAMQRHPAKSTVMHMDFLRVNAKEKLTMNVPLHFTGGDNAPGVKAGGVVSHEINELEINCLPGNLPEFLDVDISGLELDAMLHLSDITLPEGVELAHAIEDDAHNHTIVSIHTPRAAVEEEPEAEVPVEGEAAAAKADEGDKQEG